MRSCPRCRRTFEEDVRFCPIDGALTTKELSDSNIGRVLLGQFEILEVCGRGATGTVYRARQRSMDRVVAVKIIRKDILKEHGILRRFVREARAAAKLQHPNIVTVLLVGETEEALPYMVMEYVDGPSLEDICEVQGAVALPRSLALSRQIASALGEAHAAGIVHRDLKPANILITDRVRAPDVVKVLDFGIAKMVHGEAPEQSQITRDGTIFGTPHYIAPEQASGTEVDHRVDLYSLGVILFRLTTGRLPFEGSSGMQVVLKHLREAPPRPRLLMPTLPVRLEELILACLEKDRARRPADADAIVAELDKIDPNEVTGPQKTLLGMAPVAPRPATPPTVSPAEVAARATSAPSRTTTLTGEVAVETRSPSQWRFAGALAAAVAFGSAIGVATAYFRRPPPPIVAATVQTQNEEPPAPIVEKVELLQEHEVRQSGYTLRSGFRQAPVEGGSVELELILARGQDRTPIAGGSFQVTMRAPEGRDEAVVVRSRDGRRYAETVFHGPGRYRLKVLGRPPAVATALQLAFEVELKGQAPIAAKPSKRSAKNDDLPMTHILPEPAKPAAPATPVVHRPEPAVETPAPKKPTAPPPPKEEDPPAMAPAPPSDPTTLPPPAPSES